MISMRTIRRHLGLPQKPTKMKAWKPAHHFTCHYNRVRRYRPNNRAHRHGWQGWYVKRYRARVDGLFHRMRRLLRAERLRTRRVQA